jgi:hypothetical protein
MIANWKRRNHIVKPTRLCLNNIKKNLKRNGRIWTGVTCLWIETNDELF